MKYRFYSPIIKMIYNSPADNFAQTTQSQLDVATPYPVYELQYALDQYRVVQNRTGEILFYILVNGFLLYNLSIDLYNTWGIFTEVRYNSTEVIMKKFDAVFDILFSRFILVGIEEDGDAFIYFSSDGKKVDEKKAIITGADSDADICVIQRHHAFYVYLFKTSGEVSTLYCYSSSDNGDTWEENTVTGV